MEGEHTDAPVQSAANAHLLHAKQVLCSLDLAETEVGDLDFGVCRLRCARI